MALSKIQPASMDLTANYAFTGTNSIPSASSGTYEEKKLTTLTASSSGTLSFTSNIDSTYNIYKFRFVNIHPGTDNPTFKFQCSTDGGSNYNTSLTSTVFIAKHNEDDSATQLVYRSGQDQANGTSFQTISEEDGADNDQNLGGELFLFDPSDTTFVKHFTSRVSTTHSGDRATDIFAAGYFNTTSAINAIQFKFSSGNIDSGTIEMYGIN